MNTNRLSALAILVAAAVAAGCGGSSSSTVDPKAVKDKLEQCLSSVNPGFDDAVDSDGSAREVVAQGGQYTAWVFDNFGGSSSTWFFILPSAAKAQSLHQRRLKTAEFAQNDFVVGPIVSTDNWANDPAMHGKVSGCMKSAAGG